MKEKCFNQNTFNGSFQSVFNKACSYKNSLFLLDHYYPKSTHPYSTSKQLIPPTPPPKSTYTLPFFTSQLPVLSIRFCFVSGDKGQAYFCDFLSWPLPCDIFWDSFVI
eukprot:TRINITY_DN3501_c0_g1_i10.p16 TRINITY_DN3501_c0_g1~~TRINITY_DN3501_c0_g1_i10.p16  ORF type:complete len:108 (+),score=0.51 TRINITY_DN3501_c0_g1_i10:3430-3753(+)